MITMIESTTIPASRLVKELGSYLYKNIDSAYKFRSVGNTYDVYITVYYQNPEVDVDILEMNIDLSIATYANKLRINLINLDEAEKTLASYIFNVEELENKEEAKKKIWKRIVKKLNKEYEEYDFIF